MEIVAIARLATPAEDEARALAAELGTLPYEQRLKLNGGQPSIVLVTPDAARAAALAASLEARGHEIVRCRAEDVTATEQMIELRTFRIEPGGLHVQQQGAEHRLHWNEIAALVRATHRMSTETRTVTTEKRFSAAKLAVTGGLSARKTVTSQMSGYAHHIEPVLYLFPRADGPPWLLREAHARYDQMGVPRAGHSARNFQLAVEQVRARATGAAIAERLVARKGKPAEIDVLAHLVATSIRTATSPFR